MKIKNATDTYTELLVGNKCSPLTIKIYQKAVADFIVHSGVSTSGAINKVMLRNYWQEVSRLDKSPKTKNLKIIPLRSFIKFLNSEGLTSIPVDSILYPFRSPNERRPLTLPTREELQPFLEHRGSARGDLIVNLLYSAGLRVAELNSLNIEDLKQEFSIVGKGGRERTVFLPPQTLGLFGVYKTAEGRDTGPLFVNERGERVTNRTVQRAIKMRAAKLLPGKHVTAHTLRHLYATHLYENGVDLMTLKEMLGHASVATTQIYTHVTTEKMRDAYKKHPLVL